MEKITQQFLPDAQFVEAIPLTGGLIHQTYKVSVKIGAKQQSYILQRFSQEVFKSPGKVMQNLLKIQQTLQASDYPLVYPALVQATDGKLFWQDDLKQYWRVFEFVEGSLSYESPPSEEHLFNAGRAYGYFISALKNLAPASLEITISNFHNLAQRYQHFEDVVQRNPKNKNESAAKAIQKTKDFYRRFPIDFSKLPLRVTHNDCKLSNVLFDEKTDECIAVIDLDTVMPGYVVTDFGDMVRTMCNTATEEEKDLSKVAFNHKNYERLKQGFLESTEAWLTTFEKENLRNGAIYIILEQAIRFLADHLDGDPYYGARYEGHNLVRAENQLWLLQSLINQNQNVNQNQNDAS